MHCWQSRKDTAWYLAKRYSSSLSKATIPPTLNFDGYWENNEQDTTSGGSGSSIKVISHELRMIRFITADQLKEKLPEIKRTQDLTSDMHLQEAVGVFSDLNDAAVGGISLIQNTSVNRGALNNRTFNFAGLTWQTTTVDIPDDGNDYWVVVRIAQTVGRKETEFRLLSNAEGAGEEHLRPPRQSDTNWLYYQVVADTESIWTLQRRATNTHTRYDGALGAAAIAQVDARIPEHQSLGDLQDKTSDLHVNDPPGDFANLTDSAIGGIATLLETPAGVAALNAGTFDFTTLTWGNTPVSYSPTRGQTYRVIVRVAKTTIETQFRVLLVHAVGSIQRYYGIGDSIGSDANWNYYSAVSGELAATATLEYRASHTHTRYEGEIGSAAIEQVNQRITEVNALEPDYVTQQEFDNRQNHTRTVWRTYPFGYSIKNCLFWKA